MTLAGTRTSSIKPFSAPHLGFKLLLRTVINEATVFDYISLAWPLGISIDEYNINLSISMSGRTTSRASQDPRSHQQGCFSPRDDPCFLAFLASWAAVLGDNRSSYPKHTADVKPCSHHLLRSVCWIGFPAFWWWRCLCHGDETAQSVWGGSRHDECSGIIMRPSFLAPRPSWPMNGTRKPDPRYAVFHIFDDVVVTQKQRVWS